MRKFLTVFVFFIGFAGAAAAGGHLENEKTPGKFLKYYVDAFNAQDAEKLNTVFATPFQKIQNGKIVSYTSWREYINFEVVKKTGWKRSVINKVDIVYNSDKTAVVRFLFSRLDASDNIIAKAEAALIIVKPESMWKIATILLPASLPISEEGN